MMADRNLLQEAFDAAIKDENVTLNQTDNADPEIGAFMAKYITDKGEPVFVKEIGDFVREMTCKEDTLLGSAFDDAVDDVGEEKLVNPDEAIRNHIQEEMEAFFAAQQASIRKRRIELYIREQVKAQEEKRKQNK